MRMRIQLTQSLAESCQEQFHLFFFCILSRFIHFCWFCVLSIHNSKFVIHLVEFIKSKPIIGAMQTKNVKKKQQRQQQSQRMKNLMHSECVRNHTYCFLINSLRFSCLDVFAFFFHCSIWMSSFWHKITSIPWSNQNTIERTKQRQQRERETKRFKLNFLFVLLTRSAVTSMPHFLWNCASFRSRNGMDRKSSLCFDPISKCVANIMLICKLS